MNKLKTCLYIAITSSFALIAHAAVASSFTVKVTNQLAANTCDIEVMNGGEVIAHVSPEKTFSDSFNEGDKIAIYPLVKFQGRCTTAGVGNASVSYYFNANSNKYVSTVALMQSNPGVVTLPLFAKGTNANQNYNLDSSEGGTSTVPIQGNPGADIDITLSGGPGPEATDQ